MGARHRIGHAHQALVDEFVDAVVPQFAAEAGATDAAEGQPGEAGAVLVNVGCTDRGRWLTG